MQAVLLGGHDPGDGVPMTDLLAWAIRHGVGPTALAELHVLLRPVAQPAAEAHIAAAEAGVQACVRLAVEQWGGATWRNNSGACEDKTGRQIRYGLGNDSAKLNKVFKSADLIGVAPGGRFLAVECKARGWKYRGTEREVAQKAFLDRVRMLGGVACFASSVEDVRQEINKG
jgi:hypothetical protein